MISRPLRRIAQGAVLTAVVAGTLGAAHWNKSVTLSVDGASSSVGVFGGTVGDVLAKRGITLGPHDVVVPSAVRARSPTAPRSSVRHGRLLTVTVDGEKKSYWTTATTVSSALSEMGIRADTAKLSVSRSQTLGRQGLAVAVTTPKPVSVKVDGATRQGPQHRPDRQGRPGRDEGQRRRQGPGPPGPDLRRRQARRGHHHRPGEAEDGPGHPACRVRQPDDPATATSTAARPVRSRAGHQGKRVVSYLETWVDGKRESRKATRTHGHREAGRPGSRRWAPRPDRSPSPPTAAGPARSSGSGSPATVPPAAARPAAAPRRPRSARACGTGSPSASPAATGTSTPATATTAACSSPRPRGWPTAAATSPRAPTSPPASSRSPSPTALRPGRPRPVGLRARRLTASAT